MRADVVKLIEDLTALRRRIQTLHLAAQDHAEAHAAASVGHGSATPEGQAEFHQQQHFESLERRLREAADVVQRATDQVRAVQQEIDHADHRAQAARTGGQVDGPPGSS